MKSWLLGPILGIGLIVQIMLGFALASDLTLLVDAHVLIGIAGLLIIGFLVRESWIQRLRFGWSAFAIAFLLVVLVLVQIYLGSVILQGGNGALVSFHELNAVLILAAGIAISVMGRRRRKELEAEFRSAQNTTTPSPPQQQ